MISVLGLRLSDAVALLETENRKFRLEEVRSKKGTGGDDKRVIRESFDGESVVLTYAAFVTELKQR